MKKILFPILIALLAAALLCACGKKKEASVPPVPVPGPVSAGPATAEAPSREAAATAEYPASDEPPTDEPATKEPATAEIPAEPEDSGEPGFKPGDVTPKTVPAMPTPVATPAPTPVPTPAPTAAPAPAEFKAGTYKDADGSELTVKKNGDVSYKTEVSGTVNGSQMSGMLTFSGKVTDGKFSFTKVAYGFIDLTEIAKANGLDDASPWEDEAMELYLSKVK